MLYAPGYLFSRRTGEVIINIFLGILIVISTALVSAEETSNTIPINCDFYLNLESEMQCKNKGHDYLPNYGFHYCNEFIKLSGNWSENAKAWVQKTGQCLQEMLRDNKKNRLTSCSKMESFAFDTHPICYKESGFCDLSLVEKYKIFTTVQRIDLFTKRSAAQVLNISINCNGTTYAWPTQDLNKTGL